MNKNFTLDMELLKMLNVSQADPIKAIIKFTDKNKLITTRLLLPYCGNRNLFYWVRKTLTVWVEDQEFNYEFVGILFPEWKIKKSP